jgi:gliding motility-associated-like protein
MKKFFGAMVLFLFSAVVARTQTLTPVAVTGYNHDGIAETYPNSLAGTDTVLDASAYVMYSQAFGTAAGFGGGLPNNGLITDAGNTRQYQLAPYTGNNILNVMRNATKTLTLVTPAAYKKLSLLTFSTENAALVNVTVEFADGTNLAVSNVSLPDWFNGTTNIVIQGFGRVTRTASVTAVDGLTTNPRAYYIDIDLSCTDRKKLVTGIRVNNVTTTGANAPYPNVVLLALAGQVDTQTITSSSTPASCGAANGSVTANVTGNSGPYTISWNTTPAQTTNTISNLPAGTYIATITDANSCTSTRSVIINQLVSPSSITATATPASVCSGGNTQLTVAASGGTLASFTWTPSGNATASFAATPTITTTYTVLGLDNAGCPYSRQVTVTVNQRPAAPVVPNISVCRGTNAVLQVQGAQAGYIYNWYTAATGGSAVFTGPAYTINNPSTSLTYYVEAVNSSCSSPARTQVTATLLPMPTVNAGQDKTIVAGDVIQLAATASTGGYLWSPATALSSPTILNPSANPSSTTNYVLSVTDPLGCIKTDTVLITVLPYCVKPTDAFTPNGDGINDTWRIFDGTCTAISQVAVFNRYGNEVFKSGNYKNDWNGSYKGNPLPDGTYYYVITYQLVNSRSVYIKGSVTILR